MKKTPKTTPEPEQLRLRKLLSTYSGVQPFPPHLLLPTRGS